MSVAHQEGRRMLQSQFDALKAARQRAMELQGTDRGVMVLKRWTRAGTVGYIVHEFEIGERETWAPHLAPRPHLDLES
jgi:hypothetical protein